MLGILLQNVRRNTLTRTRWLTILVGFGWMTSPTQTVSIFFFMRDIFCIKFCIRQSMKRATVLKISKEIERNQRLYKATFEVTKTVHGSQWLEFNFTMILCMQSFSRARFSWKYLETRVLSKFIKDANFCKVLDNLEFKLKRDKLYLIYCCHHTAPTASLF